MIFDAGVEKIIFDTIAMNWGLPAFVIKLDGFLFRI